MRILTIANLFGMVAIICSCKSGPVAYEKDFPIHIRLSEFAESDKVISKISSLADSISYVRLETGNAPMIGYGNPFEIPGGYLIQTSTELLFFSSDGKYLHKISKVGRGPGEYNRVSSAFGLDRERKQLFIPDQYHSMLVYGFDGSLRSGFSISTDHKIAAAIPDGTCFTGSMLCATPSVVYMPNGDICSEDTIHINPDETRTGEGSFYMYRLFFVQADNGLWVNEPDTTWLYTTCSDKKPFLIINPFASENETTAYIYRLLPMTDNYFAIGHSACGFYSLNDRHYYRIQSDSAYFSLEDDIDHGPPVTFSQAHQSRMLQLVPAVELLYPDDPSKQASGKLQKIINELDANDNPVIRIMWLRNNIGSDH